MRINQYTQSDFINSPYGYNLTYVRYSAFPIRSEELSLWLRDCVQSVRRTNPTEPAQGALFSIATAFQSTLPWALDTIPSCQAAQHNCTYIFHFLLSPSGTEIVSAERVGGIHRSPATRMSHRVCSSRKTGSSWLT